MRSAELAAVRLAAAALAALALSGCASVMEPIKSMRDAVMPSSSTPPTATATTNANAATGARSTGTASAGAAGPAPAASAPPAVTAAPADVAVSAESQRAFDDAARVLRGGNPADAERRFRTLAQAPPSSSTTTGWCGCSA